jgi:ribosomal protein S18 acetylase RimI-like enzyme
MEYKDKFVNLYWFLKTESLMEDSALKIDHVKQASEMLECAQLLAKSEPWTTLGMSGEYLLNTMNDPLHEVFAARIDGEIVGTMVVQTRGAFTGYLKSIALKPEWRGQLLGKWMMSYLEEKIFATSPNLFLCVSSFNTLAHNFYLKRGYEQIGVLTNYLVEGHHEILMRKTTGPILKGKVERESELQAEP